MLKHSDTIVAIATPLGAGGLGVVRLSGPDSFSITQKIVSFQESNLLTAPSHTLHHGWLHEGKSVIDEVVTGIFRSPRSYTGEDVAEISTHGSPAVLKDVVRLCVENGARMARPGEFTERAFLNGKLDLAQAEAVADLIAAQSSRARLIAAGQLAGLLSKKIAEIRGQVVKLLAQLEANLDFADEDIPPLGADQIKAGLTEILGQIGALLSTVAEGRILREGLRMAFFGKPNVGKSSLFNTLLGCDRAIVTDIPGTTRDTLEEKAQWEGNPVVLVDTAGFRTAGDPVEMKGKERAAHAIEEADLILFIADGSASLSEEDDMVYERVKGKPVIGVISKRDLKSAYSSRDFRRRFDCPTVVETSAHKDLGLKALKDAVLSWALGQKGEKEGTPVITNMRHAAQLESARGCLEKALGAVNAGLPYDAVAVDLHQALEELGMITGETAREDVLQAIFSRFCIGK